MHNTGGHGTRDAIDECLNAIKDKLNVLADHHVPQSLETNLPDLHVWHGLQSAVKKSHRHRGDNLNTLTISCVRTRNGY